jgi:protein phosphatase
MVTNGQVEASMRTDQGRVRDHNEDFVAYYEPTDPEEELNNGWLYIVADGVGGADAGEVASQYATERTLHHYLNDDETGDWGKRLVRAMRTANTELREMVARQPQKLHMATTMVATVFHDSKATLANVGDSRGYHWRDGILLQVTKDQSLVARLLEEGAITEEEASKHPRRNVILHSLGSEKDPKIDLYDVDIASGELLILCSDGLTRHVSDEEISEIVGLEPPGEATSTLIRLANERGGEDNISVAVLHYGEQSAQMKATASSVKLVTGERVQVESRKTLWVYTAILCVIQTLLIVLVWFLIVA